MKALIVYGTRYPGMLPEPGDKLIANDLKTRGWQVDFHDAQLPVQGQFDVVMIRVYASVGNDNREAPKAALQLSQHLERQGTHVINSAGACLSDYDKWRQHDTLSRIVHCPKTIVLRDRQQLRAFAKRHRRIILKPRTGGRGVGIRCLTNSDIAAGLADDIPFENSYLAQEFVRSALPFDIRICVYGDRVVYAHGRTLIGTPNCLEPWLGSLSQGSIFVKHIPTTEEIAIALTATRTLGALINEVDLVATDNGPVVIENNLTPNYTRETENLITHFCDTVTRATKLHPRRTGRHYPDPSAPHYAKS